MRLFRAGGKGHLRALTADWQRNPPSTSYTRGGWSVPHTSRSMPYAQAPYCTKGLEPGGTAAPCLCLMLTADAFLLTEVRSACRGAHPTLLGGAVAPGRHLELLADCRPDWQGAPILGCDPHHQAKGGVLAPLQHSLAGRHHPHISAVRALNLHSFPCPNVVGFLQKPRLPCCAKPKVAMLPDMQPRGSPCWCRWV